MATFSLPRFGEEDAVNRSRASPVAVNGTDPSFQILHGRPARLIEAGWRACLADSDFSTHYTAPEYFCDPTLHGRKLFAVLSIVGEDVTAVMTGLHDADRVQSGLSLRPQIAFSRYADRPRAMNNLIAGLLRNRNRRSSLIFFYGRI